MVVVFRHHHQGITPAGRANHTSFRLWPLARCLPLPAITAANAGNIATACNLLNAFINEVQAQSGKKLTVAQANQSTASRKSRP